MPLLYVDTCFCVDHICILKPRICKPTENWTYPMSIVAAI